MAGPVFLYTLSCNVQAILLYQFLESLDAYRSRFLRAIIFGGIENSTYICFDNIMMIDYAGIIQTIRICFFVLLMSGMVMDLLLTLHMGLRLMT